ncbi:unnamed protein product, partial [Symbiodinium necroappetens]
VHQPRDDERRDLRLRARLRQGELREPCSLPDLDAGLSDVRRLVRGLPTGLSLGRGASRRLGPPVGGLPGLHLAAGEQERLQADGDGISGRLCPPVPGLYHLPPLLGWNSLRGVSPVDAHELWSVVLRPLQSAVLVAASVPLEVAAFPDPDLPASCQVLLPHQRRLRLAAAVRPGGRAPPSAPEPRGRGAACAAGGLPDSPGRVWSLQRIRRGSRVGDPHLARPGRARGRPQRDAEAATVGRVAHLSLPPSEGWKRRREKALSRLLSGLSPKGPPPSRTSRKLS